MYAACARVKQQLAEFPCGGCGGYYIIQQGHTLSVKYFFCIRRERKSPPQILLPRNPTQALLSHGAALATTEVGCNGQVQGRSQVTRKKFSLIEAASQASRPVHGNGNNESG